MQTGVCVSPLSVRLFLVSAELQPVQLSLGGLQALFALLHLLLQQHVDAAELHIVRFGVCLFSVQLLDSGLQLGQKKKKGWEERLLINFNSTTQQYSSTDLFLFAQGVFQILLPNFQHLLELPSLFLLYAFLNVTMSCSNDVKMIISGPWQNLWK